MLLGSTSNRIDSGPLLRHHLGVDRLMEDQRGEALVQQHSISLTEWCAQVRPSGMHDVPPSEGARPMRSNSYGVTDDDEELKCIAGWAMFYQLTLDVRFDAGRGMG